VRAFATASAFVLAVAGAGCGSSPSPDAPAVLESATVWSDGPAWGVVVVDDAVWISDPSRGTLVSITDGQVTAMVDGGAPDPREAGLALDGSRLWVANLGGTVARRDASSGALVARVEVGPGEPAGVAVADGLAWVPLHGPGGGLVALDSGTLAVVHTVTLPESAFAVAVEGRTVWVAGLDRRLFAVDAASGAVRKTIDLGGAPRGVAVAGSSVWVTLSEDRQVVGVDARSGSIVERLEVDGHPWPIAAQGGSIWVAEVEGRLLRIDASSGEVVANAAVPAQARGIAVDDDVVWVATQAGVSWIDFE
jgi:outer membrane protein assembly factor BamB